MSYLTPSATTPLPGGLTLNQFLQTVFVGISGLAGTLVRPKWQVEPPKQVDLATNWMAFGIDVATPDANAWIAPADDDNTQMQRHESMDIGCSVYGPDALELYGIIRDGFQIPNNLEALTAANMGFTEVTPARRIPDLVNERFINRVQFSVVIRREIQRVYAIPTITSVMGTIHTVLGNEEYLLPWGTQN